MQIDILTIKSKRNAQLEFELTETLEGMETHLGDAELKEPINLKGTMTNLGNCFILKADIKTVINMKCSRCAKNVEYIVDIPIIERFVGDKAIEAEPEEDEVWFFEGNVIDLKDAVISSISLSMPMKILCSDGCKGLCPKCGQDLNESDCGCDMTEIDPRFAKLSELFKN